jgi:hypothetical protein
MPIDADKVILLLAVALALSVTVARADDPNWLANPGFETARDGQPEGWWLGMEGRGEGEAVWQQGGAHSGERCLRVKLTTDGDYYMGRQYLSQSVTPGALYRVGGWYRADAEGVAHPCVYFKTADGKFIAAWETGLAQAEAWTPFDYAFRPPPGTARFEIQLRVQGSPGTVWYDDVFLGPALAAEAAQRTQEAAARTLFSRGPFGLRALQPAERPTLQSLGEPRRAAELEQATRVEIGAARGEAVSFGAVVTGLGEAPLRAQMSDLTGPGGATLPAAQCRVCWADTVKVSSWVPDPLLERQPFHAPHEGVPMLWVTVRVPREQQPAGVYTGRLSVSVPGHGAELPVILRLYDFALPLTPALPTSFWLFRHTIRNAYGLKTVPFDTYSRYLDLCLEARLAPIDAAEWHDQPFVHMVRDAEGRLDVDWTEWDRYLAYGMARGMSAFNVADDHWFGSFFRSFEVKDVRTGQSSTVTLDPDSQAYADTVTRFFALAKAHFDGRGWSARAYLQAYDEPGRDAALLAEIKRFYSLARSGWPGLRTLITATPGGYDGLYGSIGIWCPLSPNYNEAAAAVRRRQGEEVWWYVCCGPTAPWANLFLEQPGAAPRVLLWQTFGRGAQGLLYWGVNHWPDFAARTMDPRPAEQRWPNVPWNDGGRNGDGYLMYPGPDGPLGSLRLDNLRDGLQDYDALTLLRALLQAKGANLPPDLRAQAEAALRVQPAVYQSMTVYTADGRVIAAQRARVNELVERLTHLP